MQVNLKFITRIISIYYQYLLSRALDIKQKEGDKAEIAKTLNLLAWVDYQRGRYRFFCFILFLLCFAFRVVFDSQIYGMAKDKYKNCIALLSKAQTVPIAMGCANLSLVLLKGGNAEGALNLYQFVFLSRERKPFFRSKLTEIGAKKAVKCSLKKT
jgi:hypothetical protein